MGLIAARFRPCHDRLDVCRNPICGAWLNYKIILQGRAAGSRRAKGTDLKRLAKTILVIVVAALAMRGTMPVSAQTTNAKPTSDKVADQFKSGADRVGAGAAQIGEGIKDGAIMTWQAIKAGAVAATAQFNGGQHASTESKNPTPSANPPH